MKIQYSKIYTRNKVGTPLMSILLALVILIGPTSASASMAASAPATESTALPSTVGTNVNDTRTIVPQTVVVGYKPGVDPERLAEAVGGKLKRQEPGGFVTINVPGNLNLAISRLRVIPGVLSAAKSRLIKTFGGTEIAAATGTVDQGDPGLTRQWGLGEAEVQKAWALGADGSGITIAIVDTGVDLNHPDLQDKLVPGYNAILDSTDPADLRDRNGHGTHVAGIAAAAKGNGYGIAGVAYNAKIMPIKTMDQDGEGEDTDIARGIRWAVDKGANIINLSLGSDSEEPVLQAAVQYALSKNRIVVAAAGNYDSGSNPGVSYPAADPGVIAVSAVDEQGSFADYSVSGPQISLAAPGSNILSDYWQSRVGSTYAFLDGTSMASPFVSGAAALVWSKHPEWTAEQVREALETGAVDLGEHGRDQEFGYGLVDPYRSLVISAPLVELASPASLSLGGGKVQGEAGVGLKVPALAFDQDTNVTLQKTESPGNLPSGITPTGSVFQVRWSPEAGSNTNSASESPLQVLSLSMQVSLPETGQLGYIYHWSGSRWIVVGGGQRSGTILAGIYEPGIYRAGYVMSSTQSRIAGYDRIATAVKIAEAAYPTGADTVILARADDFPDALAGVPLAYKLHAPILLTSSNSLDDRVFEAIKLLEPQKIILLGGTGAISSTVDSRARTLAPTERLAGTNRYETAGAIAKALGTHGNAVLANGDNFPDALSAAAAAAREGEPILLTMADSLPPQTDQTLRLLSVSHVTVIGGSGVVSPTVLSVLPGSTRLAGSDRYATAAAVLKVFPPEGPEVFVATGENFPDALVGGVLAAVQASGILLVPPQGVPSSQQSLVHSWQAVIPIALGGSGVVADSVLNEIR